MGCDIHFYVEKREGPDAPWQSADTFTTEGTGEDAYTSNYDHQFYRGRNYDLFAILADVRNGRGFAGIPTGAGFNPIADPRGLPEDVSEPTRAAAEVYDGDGHSHSYFTVAELLAYDWTQETTKSGDVSINQLARWKINGHPEMWSGRTSGGGIVDVDGARAVEVIDGIIERYKNSGSTFKPTWWTLFHLRAGPFGESPKNVEPDEAQFLAEINAALGLKAGERPNFQITWGTAYYEAASLFLSHTMPKLWRLGAHDDVRIVFWFDN